MADEARHARQQMLEAVAMYSDAILELLLSEKPVPPELVHQVIHDAVVSDQLTPVLLGSAYRNKGVQPLLDAVVRYLPSPLECQPKALVHEDLVRENAVRKEAVRKEAVRKEAVRKEAVTVARASRLWTTVARASRPWT